MAWLEWAAEHYNQTGQYIFNPRDLQCNSLLGVDEDWTRDFNRYLLARRFYQDYDKRPEGLK